MANRKSTMITNLEAAKHVAGEVNAARARLRVYTQTIEKAAGDGNGTLFSFFRLPADAAPYFLFFASDTLAGMTDSDIGIWAKPAPGADPTVAIAADVLADGINLAAGSLPQLNQLGQGTNGVNEADFGKALWQIGGVATRPVAGTEYDVVMRLNTAGGAAGTITVIMIVAEGD